MLKFVRANRLLPVRSFHSTHSALVLKPFLLADIGEGITECEVVQWFIKQGDSVAQFDKICEVQSDKAAVEITSRFDGVIKKLHYSVGDMAKVGAPLIDIDISDESEVKVDKVGAGEETEVLTPVKPTQAANNLASNTNNGNILATPAVRRIAKENKVVLDAVKGHGKDGRIMKEDIMNHIQNGSQMNTLSLKNHISNVSSAQHETFPPKVTTAPAVEYQDRIQDLNLTQKAMLKQMTKSLNIPHFGFSEEVIMNECSKLRDSINYSLKKDDLLIKKYANALHQFPVLNACLINTDTTSPQLKFRSSHNISIAMDTPNGLIVPNIKNVNQKSILEIAKDLERLKNLAQTSSLQPSDLIGGTITLSNIGNIGGTVLHPCLVHTEVVIGAIGRIQTLPRYEEVNVDGKSKDVLIAKDVMACSWNADHRVVDGATLARFVIKWKAYLEYPSTLLSELK